MTEKPKQTRKLTVEQKYRLLLGVVLVVRNFVKISQNIFAE